MKLLMYGAGSIGRGFIGPLFSQVGYEVVFIDINADVINALNHHRRYHYTIATSKPYDIEVTNVQGVCGTDIEAISHEIATCDIMATSLGAAILQKVSPIIASGFSLRMKKSEKPLNILICENLKDSAAQMYKWLEESLHEQDKLLLKNNCGLIETAIGRMVPVAVQNPDDPLHVTVEEYSHLPVDKDAFIGDPPHVKGLYPYSPFSFFEERKLYLHNMAHSICAYLGIPKGYEFIAEAVSDPEIRLIVQSAMVESSSMLSQKYDLPFVEVFNHAEDLLLRFGNVELLDTCERVGRDPMRKLHHSERLAGAIHGCWERNIYPVNILLGYAAALKCETDDLDVAKKISTETGLLNEEQLTLVMRLFSELGKPNTNILHTVEIIKKELRGDIV